MAVRASLSLLSRPIARRVVAEMEFLRPLHTIKPDALLASRPSFGCVHGSLSSWHQRRPLSTDEEQDTHNDFKPSFKASSDILSVKEQIEKDIKENSVMLYMKGNPDAPECGFSAIATRILQHHAVPFASRNILVDQELRQTLKTFSDWPTFPQLYVNGEFVGGCDILKKMHESGELAELLKGVP